MSILDRFLISATLRSRAMARVGPVEKLLLTRAGKADAKVGLPKESSDGKWLTAYIQREIGSCNETISERLQLIQNRMKMHYAHATELAGNIQQVENDAAKVLERIPPVPTEEETGYRKNGEEELTDDQVHKRRIREYDRARQQIEEQAETIMERASDDIRDLIKEESFISQVENLFDIFIARMTAHSHQRIDAYWNVLYSNCKENAGIPAFYQHESADITKVDFRELHAKEHALIDKVLGKYKEEAA